jgi:hypothetical protein
MNNQRQENGVLAGPRFSPYLLTVLSWLFTSIGLADPTGQLFRPKPFRVRHYETVCASTKRCSNVRLYPFSLPAYAAAFWRGCHRSIRRRTEW